MQRIQLDYSDGRPTAWLPLSRFGSHGTGELHERKPQLALHYMEEPTMLAERMTQWRQEALDEGRRQGMSEGRRQGVSLELQRLAAHRFGVAAGDALAGLLANVEDVDRLADVGDLVVDCASAEELLRRGRGVLNGGR